MKHEDGIECYLKPRGSKHDERKFREIPQTADSNDGRRMHCVVHKTKDKFNIITRVSKDFDMSCASTLLILVAVRTAMGERSVKATLVSKGRIYSGLSLRSNENHGFSFDGWNTPSWYLKEASPPAHYYLDPDPGDILISIRRGDPEWVEGPLKDYTRGPEGQVSFRPGSFTPSANQMGYPYIFRFTSQSAVKYRTTSQRCLSHVPMPLSAMDLGYALDVGFGAIRSTCRALRERMREEGKLVDFREPIGESEGSALFSRAPSAHSPGTGEHNKVVEPSASGCARSTSPQLFRSARDPSTVPICHCPKVHRARAELPGGKRSVFQTDVALSDSGHDMSDHTAHSAAPTAIEDPAPVNRAIKLLDRPQETVAKQCIGCKKFKPPPAGKKVTYRKARGKYMCVPRNAHEESGPEDTVMQRTVSETDSPARLTSIPNLPLADGIYEESASSTAASDTSPEREVSQSEISQSVPEESTAKPPDSRSPVATGLQETVEDKISYDECSITATDFITLAGTEATNQPISNKRPADPSNEQPPAKQPRIEESITTGNEIQAVSIKTEPEADPDIQFVTSQESSKTRREKRLEEDIAHTRRELRQIELEKKMEELQRQLAEEQRRKQDATPVIQVKQEVIELD